MIVLQQNFTFKGCNDDFNAYRLKKLDTNIIH